LERAWRGGKLCVDSPSRGERFPTAIRDPVGDTEERLAWYAQRALDWLESAATGALTALGDPFELPWHNPVGAVAGLPPRIVHDESEDSYAAWQGRDNEFGEARVGSVPGIEGSLAVGSFLDQEGRPIRLWGGRAVRETEDEGPTVFWWLWPIPVVLRPWQAPATWGELRRIGRSNGVDVDRVLRELARQTRGIKGAAILLIGYPIPMRIGDAPTEMHWDTVILPPVARPGRPMAGFRTNELGWWMHDRQGPFGDHGEMRYLPTENWSERRLRARGGLSKEVRSTKVALIGVGALGSVVAELLVRAGLRHLALFDADRFIAGNMCRHIATLNDVGCSKVEVARRLMQISPFVEIASHGDGLPASPETIGNLLERYDAIIDCTASSDVLAVMAQAWWATPRLFLSASVGYAASHLFVFAAFDNAFPLAQFETEIEPWLQQETSAWTHHGELLEGAGCWSPLFPARQDDLVLAAAICVKEFERHALKRPSPAVLGVFEQAHADLAFQSFSRVSQPVPDGKSLK
jgi:hypothetical protein